MLWVCTTFKGGIGGYIGIWASRPMLWELSVSRVWGLGLKV